MSDFVLKWYLRLFDSLSAEYKVELIAKLVERLKPAYNSNSAAIEEKRREAILEKLVGSWADLDIDGDAIVNSRTTSDKIYDL